MRYPNETEFNQVNVFGKGQENRGYAQYFIGDSFLNLLTDPKQCPLVLSNVTQMCIRDSSGAGFWRTA